MNLLLLVVCVIAQAVVALGQLSSDPDRLKNWCIKGMYHKTLPGPEDSLHQQCSPWKDRSCCTYESSRLNHEDPLRYRFNRSHCKPLSPKCNEHFVQDLCFYDCEPNLGPWMVAINKVQTKERFIHVPLCASDCDAWYDACKYDFTCVDNWSRGFIHANGSNHCPVQNECRTFETIFGNAKDFCEKIYDESWAYTSDDDPCMRLWFDGSAGNPNERIRDLRIQQLIGAGSKSAASAFIAIFIPLALVLR